MTWMEQDANKIEEEIKNLIEEKVGKIVHPVKELRKQSCS